MNYPELASLTYNKEYDPIQLEPLVQQLWEKQRLFVAESAGSREKFYCLAMIPYPSGRLHMGHIRNYTIADVVARYQRMRGKNVLHPIGWDAFGLPAENAALASKTSPEAWTRANIAIMRDQLKRFGFSYDETRELTTCDASYYRWEQWFFTQLYEKGLAYQAEAPVNWCPVDQTVLANEQVTGGCCWRCGSSVEKKSIKQWFLKITAYAEELLTGLDQLEGWPEQVKQMQRNWIGRSEGMNVHFELNQAQGVVTVYTTRVETIMGATFIALSPEHPLARRAAEENPNCRAFLEAWKAGGVMESVQEKQPIKGVSTGFEAIHPITQEKIPVWIANYVLGQRGTGAVMGVPAHDSRDAVLAERYGLKTQRVLKDDPDQGEAILCHSGRWDGLTSSAGITQIGAYLIERGKGERAIYYRLKDWAIARQRYWGAPIPMITDVHGEMHPVDASELPVRLPTQAQLDLKGNPLKEPAWRSITFEGQPALRECDTFDTFMESAWYYARNACPQEESCMLDTRQTKYWLPVDFYVGGIEHATMHLIYIRFFHKLLRDFGLVFGDEPVQQMLCQGMVLAPAYYRLLPDGQQEWVPTEEVASRFDQEISKQRFYDRAGREIYSAGSLKMSKSKHNGVDPAPLLQQYGADTIRLFTLFAAPPAVHLEWKLSGVEGAARFLKKLWKLCHEVIAQNASEDLNRAGFDVQAALSLRRLSHQIVKRVTEAIDVRSTFNTAIAALMELVNALQDAVRKGRCNPSVLKECTLLLVQLLAPFTPHICTALWAALGQSDPLDLTPWPEVDETLLQSEQVTVVVQVNGKKRGVLEVPIGLKEDCLKKKVLEQKFMQKVLSSYSTLKFVVVPDRLVNVVLSTEHAR